MYITCYSNIIIQFWMGKNSHSERITQNNMISFKLKLFRVPNKLFFFLPISSRIQSWIQYIQGQGLVEVCISLIFTLVSEILRKWPVMFLEHPLSVKISTYNHLSTVWNFIPYFHSNSQLLQHSAKAQWRKIGSSAFQLSKFHTTNTAIKSILAYLHPSRVFLQRSSLILSPFPDWNCSLR